MPLLFGLVIAAAAALGMSGLKEAHDHAPATPPAASAPAQTGRR